MFAAQFGLTIDYQAIETDIEHFAEQLHQLAARGARGCNVTFPLKNLAWQQAQRVSKSAQRAQAVNTLVFEDTDNWYGDSTDGPGLVRDIKHNQGLELAGSRLCIIGAGGAAAGILGDLLDQKPANIVIANRTLERAQSLQKAFGDPVVACSLDALGEGAPYDLVINATSGGHSGERLVLPSTLFSRDSLCYDLNYGSAAQPLRSYCAASGIRYQDGFGMLVEQAALSFELWTSKKPKTKSVLNALRQV